MATEITKQYHLNTIKDTLDYLHAKRLKAPSEMLDSMIHDLTKVVRLIKGLKEDAS